MSELTEPLPDGVEALRALLRGALSECAVAIAERDAAIVERDRALGQNERFRHLLQQLRRAHFGRSSEKLDPDQLRLALEDIEQAVARGVAEEERRSRR